jgi:hypothetical protein
MMQNRTRKRRMCARIFGFVVLAAVSGAVSAAAFAQTDEIQVYDASIAPVGIFNLTWHNNYTPNGMTTPAFPGAIISNKSWNGVTEWAYGLTTWWEQGLYLPLYSVSQKRGGSINGFKIRELFVRPHADDHVFFYGVNFEFSYNQRYWNRRVSSLEIRPIIGLHLKPWDLIVNPIVDSDYLGGFKGLDFVPAARVAYNFNSKWAGAIEEYADYGTLRNFYGLQGQTHQVWAVTDFTSKTMNVEAGVGFGLTSASDKLTLKLILSRDLNSKPWPASRR